MSNILFPPISAPKLSSWMFKGLVGMSIPAKSKTNTGSVGNFIDSYVKTQLNIPTLTTIVDLAHLDIEIKSKDISTNSDWSIGSMTLEDIVNTPYLQSTVYQKLQALLLVTTDDTFQVIKDIGLYYFDDDNIQLLLEKSYEDARSQLRLRVANHAKNIGQKIRNGDYNSVFSKVPFSSFEKFQGDYGKFEYTNNSNSFMFRLSILQMRHLTTLAATKTSLIEFV